MKKLKLEDALKLYVASEEGKNIDIHVRAYRTYATLWNYRRFTKSYKSIQELLPNAYKGNKKVYLVNSTTTGTYEFLELSENNKNKLYILTIQNEGTK